MKQISDHLRSTVIPELTRFLEDDYLGLWIVISTVKDVLPHASEEEIKDATLLTVRILLEDSRVMCGEAIEGGGFELWHVGSNSALDRIDAAWRTLGREPTIGEVVWFNYDHSCPLGEH